jgi:hypothetical protein
MIQTTTSKQWLDAHFRRTRVWGHSGWVAIGTFSKSERCTSVLFPMHSECGTWLNNNLDKLVNVDELHMSIVSLGAHNTLVKKNPHYS